MNLELDLGEPRRVWEHVPIEDPRARELADRHYSRQQVGTDGFVPPGERVLLMHTGLDRHGRIARAIWAVCRNQFRDRWRFRNTIFRNETTTRSSDLIRAAVIETGKIWVRRYHLLPIEPLTTEIDVEATKRRRSRRSMPGVCYMHAGWEFMTIIEPGHGRPKRAVWRCPDWAWKGIANAAAAVWADRLA